MRVLLVGFGFVVTIIEAAEAMEVITTIFAQSFDESKSDVEPVLITRGDVDAGGFDLLDKGLDVGSEVV